MEQERKISQLYFKGTMLLSSVRLLNFFKLVNVTSCLGNSIEFNSNDFNEFGLQNSLPGNLKFLICNYYVARLLYIFIFVCSMEKFNRENLVICLRNNKLEFFFNMLENF